MPKSPSARIKARILQDYPDFSVARERVTEKRRTGPVTFTRATLITPDDTIFARADGPDWHGALVNLAWRLSISIENDLKSKRKSA